MVDGFELGCFNLAEAARGKRKGRSNSPKLLKSIHINKLIVSMESITMFNLYAAP
jgi:hypothetical protein